MSEADCHFVGIRAFDIASVWNKVHIAAEYVS